MWRHDNGELTEWLGTASGGFTDNGANAFSSVSTDWSVAGIGDFNGDNRDDILWRHDNGHLTDWLGTANGGFTDNGANAFSSVSTDWSVAGIGDFNGDSRDDILWRHDNGHLTEWLGTGQRRLHRQWRQRLQQRLDRLERGRHRRLQRRQSRRHFVAP